MEARLRLGCVAGRVVLVDWRFGATRVWAGWVGLPVRASGARVRGGGGQAGRVNLQVRAARLRWVAVRLPLVRMAGQVGRVGVEVRAAGVQAARIRLSARAGGVQIVRVSLQGRAVRVQVRAVGVRVAPVSQRVMAGVVQVRAGGV